MPFSCVDGPGNRMAVFMQGCLLKCQFCHNPETWSFDKTKGELISLSSFLGRLEKVAPYIRGVTFSGGEPLLQKKALESFVVAVKERGFSVFLNSNAYLIDPQKDETLLSLFEGVMIDLKSMDEEEHRRLTSVPLAPILEGAKFLAKLGNLFEVRTVIISDYLDNESNVLKVSSFLKEHSPHTHYKLISFRPHGVDKSLLNLFSSPKKEYMDDLEKLAKKYIDNVFIC